MKVVSSREFNQDVSQAKRFARDEPVFVTDRGKPTHVLLGIEAFRRMGAGGVETIVDRLAAADLPDLDLDLDPDLLGEGLEWTDTARTRR